MSQKKGQITLFIIIGIVILIILGFFLYIRSSTTQEDMVTKLTQVQEVSRDFDLVYDYIDNCLNEIATEGLQLIGERGGYINPGEYGVSAGTDATESSGIRLAKNWLIPYWFYMRSENTCEGTCAFTVVPEVNLFLTEAQGSPSIEGQLKEYLEDNLDTCLGEFLPLKEQGFDVKELGSLRATALIAENDVIFSIEYPLKVTLGEKSQDISNFFIRAPVNLRKFWEAATVISSMQSQFKYLERLALNLIVAYSGMDSDDLPPMSQLTFEFGSEKRWQKSMINKKIKDMLALNVPLIKVYNTKNYQYISAPGNRLKESMLNEGVTILGNSSWSDLEVNFAYLGWDPYFDLNCKGDSCESTSASFDLFGLFGFQQYNFAYDLSFPALVTIADPKALNQRGFVFNLMLEANIRNNKPMSANFSSLGRVPYAGESMLCDYDKRNSGEIDITVRDIENKPVQDAEVTFTCGQSCYIGRTGADGKLKTRFPICLGGIVNFMKQDYLRYSAPLSTAVDRPEKFMVQMTPILTKKLVVKKALLRKNPVTKVFDRVPQTFVDPVNITENETALITLERLGSINEQGHSSMAEYHGGQGPVEIQIAPGNYSVRIDLFYNGDVSIPEEVRRVGDESVTIPEMEFNDMFPNGGLYYDHNFNMFNLNKGDLTFIALSPNIPFIPEAERTVEDITQVSKLGFYSYNWAYPLQVRYGP
ncbi:MAG: hypothetical protein KJ601_03730 [Nanoarchaeota archaeon]|nr:hypothetical protein [Nanoarchaeota archaeon]MBU1703908.1 hypothetical protein [Nanoarchaeota archaeon]